MGIKVWIVIAIFALIALISIVSFLRHLIKGLGAIADEEEDVARVFMGHRELVPKVRESHGIINQKNRR
jgi:hypothetical protein